MKVFLDTSVLVASAVRDHPHYERAMPVIRRIISGRDNGFTAAHGLLETYAVLTTLPVTPRIGPAAAEKLVVDNLIDRMTTVVLTAREYERLIRELPQWAAMGRAVYDALHLACASKAGVERIYTFNVDDFRRLAPSMADIIVAP